MNQQVTQEKLDATLKTLQSLASAEGDVDRIAEAIGKVIAGESLEASFCALLKVTGQVAQYRLKGTEQKAAALCFMSTATNLSIEANITDEEWACLQVLV